MILQELSNLGYREHVKKIEEASNVKIDSDTVSLFKLNLSEGKWEAAKAILSSGAIFRNSSDEWHEKHRQMLFPLLRQEIIELVLDNTTQSRKQAIMILREKIASNYDLEKVKDISK